MTIDAMRGSSLLLQREAFGYRKKATKSATRVVVNAELSMGESLVFLAEIL